MNYIKFTTNWNNKLTNDAFTDIRLRDDDRYIQGELYEIWFKDELIGIFSARRISHFRLHELSEWGAQIAFGTFLDKAKTIIRRLYPYVKDWKTQQLSMILLHKEKRHHINKQQTELFEQTSV